MLDAEEREMLIKTVDVNETQTPLKDLVSLAVAGTEIVFVEGGTPVARLVPMNPRIAGLHSRAMRASDDFDQPLPDEFWIGKV
jgi:antitoxin (DNA-binding transcriptional repressor) of toxin-antitoxin stability system